MTFPCLPSRFIQAASFAICLCTASAFAQPSLRDATPAEQSHDAAAFAGIDKRIEERFQDVQSVVVISQGRVAFQYHRDGNPDTLRDTQSVSKSALAALVGAALRQGHIASLDQPVVALMPEWRELNTDPRAQSITLQHLLTMTGGFDVDDPAGTARWLARRDAWARPLRNGPGEVFAYDNSTINLVIGVLEKASGRPLAEYAREQLGAPMKMGDLQFKPGLAMRTLDIAKIGQLFLQDGKWDGAQLLPPGFAALTTKQHNRGGPPLGLPYGMFWWVPSESTFFASGYAGQFIWVHKPLGLVIAITSTVSPQSQQRGQALQLIRGPLFEAASRRPAS